MHGGPRLPRVGVVECEPVRTSLPLMQSEVRRIGLGDVALEEVAQIFVTMMALGEMTGPVCGGPAMIALQFVRGIVKRFIRSCQYIFQVTGAGATCVPLLVPSDEASFAWRRIPFALAVQRQMYRVPGSAPSSVFRKRFVSEAVVADGLS